MMRPALLAGALLACLLAVQAASVPALTDQQRTEYDRLVGQVREQRWQRPQGAQPGDSEMLLAAMSAALLTQLPQHHGDESWQTVQRRLQLQQNAERVNLGKVQLDGMLSVGGQLRQEKVLEALRRYLKLQQAMAMSLGLDSASDLWWSPFVTSSGSARSSLETMWSQVGPLVSGLVDHLRGLPVAEKLPEMVYACAARDDCSALVKAALPYPDVANVLSSLLREKDLSPEQLSHLAEQFLSLLGLPEAPAQFWADSEFSSDSDCHQYVDSERMRLCAGADAAVSLRSALTLLTDAEYLRTAADSQKAPFQTPAFPGFERALSSCVSLLALQPSVVQQLVYGYTSEGGPARLAPVSLYLAHGARPGAGRRDSRCGGDLGCQQAANALMEAAVTQLLPLGYHMASLRWLETLQSTPDTDATAAWRAELQTVLGAPPAAAAPADLDPAFYDASGHIGRLLAGVAGFQLREAACPAGGECLPAGAAAAGSLISRVMSAGSSLPWDRLLSETTLQPPGAGPLLAFFQPLQRQLAAAAAQAAQAAQPHRPIKTFELEDDTAEKSASSAAHQKPALPLIHAPTAEDSYCGKVQDKTDQEKALCEWNDQYDGLRANVTDAEWEFGLDTKTDEKADDLVTARKRFVQARNTARSALTGDANKWIRNNKSADEVALWGEMFILSEKDVGAANNEDAVQKALDDVVNLLQAYTRVSICPYENQNCKDEEKMTIWELQAAMAAGGMADAELKYYWRQYRAAAQTDLNHLFDLYISSGHNAAVKAGLTHYGQFWLEPYGYGSKDETLLTELANTWEDLDGLYKSLHTVVRFQLQQAGVSSASGRQPLPSHLTGDMFAADWRNIYNQTKLFDNYTVDISDKLVEKSYDIVNIQNDAIAYLKALKLEDPSASPCFGDSNWKACSKDQDCDALAWTSGEDNCVKIRVTDEVTMDNYERVHSKSAELSYYLSYMNLDPEYRAPANPAFTEAVAGAVSLSVLAPVHLKSKDLLPMDETDVDDSRYDIDFLYRRALQYLAPMPFNYVTSKWMWELLTVVDMERREHRWWELREEIQGVQPPETRTPSNRDMLAVPDIARDRPAFQSYMATVLQFQLFEKLCVDAGLYDRTKPEQNWLHRCDLTSKPDSAASLIKLMEAGNSARWQQLLADHTVNGSLSSDSMVNYFMPLSDHLQTFISEKKLQTGWDSNLSDLWDEEIDNTVPIVVGVVLGVLVLIVVIAYFVSRARRNKSEE